MVGAPDKLSGAEQHCSPRRRSWDAEWSAGINIKLEGNGLENLSLRSLERVHLQKYKKNIYITTAFGQKIWHYLSRILKMIIIRLIGLNCLKIPRHHI